MNKLNFNDIVKTFFHDFFGNLSIIKNHYEEDSYWFFGKEIQNLLEIKKLERAITNAELEDDEVFIMEKNNNDEFFNDLINFYDNKGGYLKEPPSGTPVISKFSNKLTLISESGVYGLIMASRKPKGKDFRKILRLEVMPKVRKSLFGEPQSIILNENLLPHINIDIQKANSKWYNWANYQNGGAYNVINKNRNICLKLTGKAPAQWKREGQDEAVKRGLSISKVTSGLDGLRLLKPAHACLISLNKNLQQAGENEDKAIAITLNNSFITCYTILLKNNIIPHEFYEKE